MATITTVGIKAGDTIYVAKPMSWDTDIKPWTVDRVTKGGQVIVTYGKDKEYELRFNKDGYEIDSSSSKYRRSYLVDKDSYDDKQKRTARDRAERDIRAEIEATKTTSMAALAEHLDRIKAMIAELN
jgi:hypothetical protein